MALKTQKGWEYWIGTTSTHAVVLFEGFSRLRKNQATAKEKVEGSLDSFVLRTVLVRLRYGRFSGGFMRRSNGRLMVFAVQASLLCVMHPTVSGAQARAVAHEATDQQAVEKDLTVDRIYSGPSLSGHPTPGIAWAPDGKRLSFFKELTGLAGKEDRQELWLMDATSGESRLLVSAEKLESVLAATPENATQATGLGRHAPARYQWAPDGTALLFQGPRSLAWFDLKTQTARPLVSGKEPIADPKISPDGHYVSFVRDHNVWLVRLADGKEHAFTKGGTEEIRKGELDWVYPEELEITTAYWWSPDSSAIAYLEM